MSWTSHRSAGIGFVALGVLGLGLSGATTVEAKTSTASFACTGAAQNWLVPAGITTASFHLLGAQGGAGGGMVATPAAGGKGGETIATISVAPGTTLQINVGCKGVDSPGSPGAAGGFNGGGTGADGVNAGGGGGGGGTDVRQGGLALANRVLVAGGGGGGGGDAPGATTPGTGGAGGGQPGGDGVSPDLVGGAGTGGTASAGGTHGGCQNAGCIGTDGASGVGGNGGGSVPNGNAQSGGGGGGGLFGGGGGGGDTNVGGPDGGGGGGGGSGLGASTAANVQSGNGAVTITFGSPDVPPTGVGGGFSTAWFVSSLLFCIGGLLLVTASRRETV